jgi:long-chain acyl-CoA synthetase
VSTLHRIIPIVRRAARLKGDEPITADTGLIRSGLWLDSVAVLELVVALEKEFGIGLDRADLAERGALATAGSLAAAMEALAGSARCALYDLLMTATGSRPEKPAIVEGPRSLTYAQLDRAAGFLGRRFREAGLGPGSVVALQLPSSAEYVAALLAVWRIGGTALPLDPALVPAEVQSYVSRAQAAAVLAPGDPRMPPLEALLESTEAADPAHPFDPDAPALLALSSGTTGLPKFVSRTARQTWAAGGVLPTTWPWAEDDRVLSLLPLFHTAGLFNGLLGTLLRGTTLYLEPLAPRQNLATLRDRRITVLMGMPLAYRLLVEAAPPSAPGLPSLRIAFSSTAPLTRNIVDQFEQRFGVPLCTTYGTTETHSITATRSGQRVDPPNLVGKPLPEVVVSIRDEAGLPAPAGVEGTIWVRCPGAAREYLHDPEATAATFRQGWVVTCDLGRMDELGNVYILGRRRPLVSIAGKKVAPAEVEACLRSHPAVADVVVRGEGDGAGDECVEARVVKAGEVTAGELRDYCAARLADFKIPRRIEFVSNLSRGPLGKSS